MERKRIVGFGVCGAVLLLFFGLKGFVEGWTKHRENRLAMNETYLAEMAGDMNKDLPHMLDADLRLDHVAAGPGKRLTFTSTFVRASAGGIDKKALAGVVDEFKKSRCGEPAVKKAIDRDVTVDYVFKDKDGRPLTELVLTSSDC
jgi:hypothetical protein